jgi:hypothetical protein
MDQTKTLPEKLSISWKRYNSTQKERIPIAMTVRSGLHAGYRCPSDCWQEYQLCGLMCQQEPHV